MELELTLPSGMFVWVTDISMAPAEPNVGIMNDYIDGYTVFAGREEGNVNEPIDVTEKLTEAEHDFICTKIYDAIRDSYPPDDFGGPEE